MDKNKEKILFKDEARKGLLQGIDLAARAAAVTLGPKGRVVVLDQAYGAPVITKDGVSVAKKVYGTDPISKIGVRLAQEVASKTNNEVGDGTTTSLVLLRAIVSEALKSLQVGVNPTDLKKGIDKALEKSLQMLDQQAKPITGSEQKKQIATISANGDSKIGAMVTEAFDKVGESGIITVEEGKGIKTEVRIEEGMQFDRGYLSPLFINNPEKATTDFDNAYILIVNKKITNVEECLPILNAVSKSGRPLLIIAEAVEGLALTTLFMNSARGLLQCVPVKAPGFGDRRMDILEDIAVLTGATVIDEAKGHKLEKAGLDHLGSAGKVHVDKDRTTIVNGGGRQEKIKARVDHIKALLDATSSDYDREKLQERWAKLSSGVAVISVGAETEVAMKERKDRVEDALNATRAAIKGGIVPGGGVALLRIADALKTLADEQPTLGEAIGVRVAQKGLEAPLRMIAANAGKEAAIVAQNVRKEKGNIGYDALEDEYRDMLEAGIIDAVPVVKQSLQSACSIAGLLVLTECVIPEEEKEKDSGMNAPMRGPGGMM